MEALLESPRFARRPFFYLDLIECENMFSPGSHVLNGDAMLSHLYQRDFFAPARFSEVYYVSDVPCFRLEINKIRGISEVAS